MGVFLQFLFMESWENDVSLAKEIQAHSLLRGGERTVLHMRKKRCSFRGDAANAYTTSAYGRRKSWKNSEFLQFHPYSSRISTDSVCRLALRDCIGTFYFPPPRFPSSAV